MEKRHLRVGQSVASTFRSVGPRSGGVDLPSGIVDKVGMSIKRVAYLASGILMVLLGALGILLPLLPTTPFLLLAAFLFSRSSSRWHDWLLGHRHLGPYIHAFRDKTGLTVAQKLRICISMTIVMGLSFYFSPIPTVKWLLGGIWLFWTVQLLRMKTAPNPAAVE